jgi:hypothetical protein
MASTLLDRQRETTGLMALHTSRLTGSRSPSAALPHLVTKRCGRDLISTRDVLLCKSTGQGVEAIDRTQAESSRHAYPAGSAPV